MAIAGLVLLILLAAAAESSDGAAIKRLPPSAFPALPRAMSRYLTRRKCTIPQSAYGEGRHNVIRGQFMVRGRSDWAVLCSRDGTSTILVFAPGRAKPIAEVGWSEDVHYLQGGVGGRPDFSHSISVATRKKILSYRRAFGGWLPRPLDHEGIDDSFDGKASVVRYFYKGRWVELTGMD
jgi:hypothetical protein